MKILCTLIILVTMSFNSWSQTDLSDINGRELQVFSGQGLEEFDVFGLFSGMYILAIESEEGRVFEKLIVSE